MESICFEAGTESEKSCLPNSINYPCSKKSSMRSGHEYDQFAEQLLEKDIPSVRQIFESEEIYQPFAILNPLLIGKGIICVTIDYIVH